MTVQQQTRSTEIRASSYDETSGTVEIVYSTGSVVDRGGYLEELEISPEAIVTERLDAGAVHLIVDHMPYGMPIGRVVSHRIDDGAAIAVVKLSESAEMAGIVADIRAGVIRSVSVGYAVYEYADREENGVKVRRAVRWMPAEISLTVLPADPGAQIRSAASTMNIRTIGESRMDPENDVTDAAEAVTEAVEALAEAAEGTDADVDALVDEIAGAAEAIVDEVETAEEVTTDEAAAGDVTAERTRSAAIVALATRHGMPANFAARHIAAGSSINTVRAAVMASISERSAKPMSARTTIRRDERETLVIRATAAIVARATRAEPGPEARELRNLSLVELARRFVPGGHSMNRIDVVRQALAVRSGMHTTSDFAAVLGAAGERTLRDSYAAAVRTYAPLVREVDLPDFRAVERVSLGDAPALELTPEGAEVKLGTMGDSSESYKLATYRKGIAFTRQAIVNDDLGAFTRLSAAFGASAGRTESSVVYSILTGAHKMSDGKLLFGAGRGNLLAQKLDVAGLAAARAAMRKQKSAEGNALDLSPRYLVVGPDLETEAMKLLAPISAVAFGEVNPFSDGSIKLIVDSRINGVDWFLVADPSMIDTIETGYLDGQRGVQVETHDAPDLDGVKILARLDFAAAPIDFRGLVKSTGA